MVKKRIILKIKLEIPKKLGADYKNTFQAFKNQAIKHKNIKGYLRAPF